MKRWSEEDIKFLKEQYNEQPLRDVAIALERSPSAVATKAHRIGISKEKVKRSVAESVVRKNRDKTNEWIANKLGVTVETARALRKKVGAEMIKYDSKPLPEKPGDRIYALYEGDEWICSGTMHNISCAINRSPETVRGYQYEGKKRQLTLIGRVGKDGDLVD